jgi:SAM-dependent methyltransferase
MVPQYYRQTPKGSRSLAGANEVMNSDVYERYWEPGKAWSPSEHPFYPYERALIEETGRRGGTCLDYGCGDAKRYGKILQEMGFDYRGVDISETAVRQAAALGLNASVLNSDGTTNLPDESCDFAICFEVFEHLMEPHHALAEIRRVLKPGGYLICSVPNAAYFARRIEFLCTGFLNPKGDPTIERSAPWRDPHIRFFSANILERFLASENFREIAVSGSPFTLDFLLYSVRFIEPGSSAERALRALLNSLSWLSKACPALFARRLLAAARKPFHEP